MPVGPFRRPPVAISILRPFGRGPSGLPNGRTFLERHLPELTEFPDDQWLPDAFLQDIQRGQCPGGSAVGCQTVGSSSAECLAAPGTSSFRVMSRTFRGSSEVSESSLSRPKGARVKLFVRELWGTQLSSWFGENFDGNFSAVSHISRLCSYASIVGIEKSPLPLDLWQCAQPGLLPGSE